MWEVKIYLDGELYVYHVGMQEDAQAIYDKYKDTPAKVFWQGMSTWSVDEVCRDIDEQLADLTN
jgi:hypothetical protein